MKIQGIQNQTSFNGVVNISENLSPKMRNEISKSLKNIDISKKSYDLYIQNVENNKFLSIEAVNSKSNNEKYTVKIHEFLQKQPLIKNSIAEAMEKYEKLSAMPNKTFEKVI